MSWLIQIERCLLTIAAVCPFRYDLKRIRHSINGRELSRFILTLPWPADRPLLLLLAISCLHSRILTIEYILVVVVSSPEIRVGPPPDGHDLF